MSTEFISQMARCFENELSRLLPGEKEKRIKVQDPELEETYKSCKTAIKLGGEAEVKKHLEKLSLHLYGQDLLAYSIIHRQKSLVEYLISQGVNVALHLKDLTWEPDFAFSTYLNECILTDEHEIF